MGALELSAQIQAGKIGAVETVAKYIRIAKNSRLNTFLAIPEERVLARAKEVQDKIDAGITLSPLAGVPVAVKDNISTEGTETTCASRMLEGYVPVFNATVIDKLEQAGMVVIGKVNMDEFAMGGSSETGYFGAVRNPWDATRVAGGSSGGSAAAVAAMEAPMALGSDTGGSIRQPCAFCGVTGIKPTYGSVSRYGLIAYASSMDQIGVIGTDINDCAALLEIISGPDTRDSTCVTDAPFAFGKENAAKIKIGLPRNYFNDSIDPEIIRAIFMAVKVFEDAGAVVEEFQMPLVDYIVPAYYALSSAEASSNLARFDGLKYGHRATEAKSLSDVYTLSRSQGFGMEVKRRIILGSFVLSSGYYDAYYRKALEIRGMIKEAYNQLFARYDVILAPVAPTTAYKLGENITDPMKMYMADVYTASVNLAGLPAVALPCGFDAQGLPIGMQLIGDAFSEPLLVAAARKYQACTDYHTRKPGVPNL
ncbi:MAG: Asp-tRNA(Asn)/Glu-tRNA(Gln) amidotransferase subunit GatA [Defluviitaleaceae bacterium]|nr:Asp-tRNA(Asn)/Glu-tRNA(Gln) amidotransferase subunit GatA [Defluviitaleaceae bacterium]MCL2238947.1 Asp-tRNA(Asn)/Glu-tRNA(Gln) amidotransferase subunit GatA [Defluviitaleaceae bacterium]